MLKVAAVIAIVGLMIVAVLTVPDDAVAQRGVPPGGGGPCETLISDAYDSAGIDILDEASCETEEQGGRRYLCGQATGWTMDLQYRVGRECVDLGPIDP